MDAGVTYAKAWNLRPGVGLTAEQMAQLTSDMAWLVEQDVRLADGSSQKVLVPQLYARTRWRSGAQRRTACRQCLSLNVTGDINNLGTLARSSARRFADREKTSTTSVAACKAKKSG